MNAQTPVDPSAPGKRQSKRARVLIAAKLETPFGEVDVRLRDLSRRGALVECSLVPPVGSEVVFMRGSTIIPARVAWTGLNRIGLEFHYEIDAQEVLIQLKKPAGQTQQRFRRPGLSEGLSDQDRKLARAWGVTVGLNVPEGSF